MKTPTKNFFELTAADLMSQPVRAIPEDMPLQDAARLLSHSRVTGAPVVDANGCCVGVLSGSDFVRWAELGYADNVRCTVPACSDWQVMELEFFPRDEVRWHMTADPVMVRPDATIIDLAQSMVDTHIHRVIVVDADYRPIGIVSTTDVLAAVAEAANLGALPQRLQEREAVAARVTRDS